MTTVPDYAVIIIIIIIGRETREKKQQRDNIIKNYASTKANTSYESRSVLYTFPVPPRVAKTYNINAFFFYVHYFCSNETAAAAAAEHITNGGAHYTRAYYYTSPVFLVHTRRVRGGGNNILQKFNVALFFCFIPEIVVDENGMC